MLDAVEEHWEDAGLEDRLHLERFSLELGGDGGEGGTITFQNSGKTVEVDGATTMLEAGEEAGVGMPYGCRMGICHTCTLTLVEGTVRDLRNGDEYGQPERAHPDLRHRRRRRLHARHLTTSTTTRDRPKETAWPSPTSRSTPTSPTEEVEQLGRELDAIRAEIEESRGDADAAYINRHDHASSAASPPPAASPCSPAQSGKPAWSSPAPPCSAWPRSSRTWRSATTSCTASGTG